MILDEKKERGKNRIIERVFQIQNRCKYTVTYNQNLIIKYFLD